MVEVLAGKIITGNFVRARQGVPACTTSSSKDSTRWRVLGPQQYVCEPSPRAMKTAS